MVVIRSGCFVGNLSWQRDRRGEIPVMIPLVYHMGIDVVPPEGSLLALPWDMYRRMKYRG
jgi:hypothetical protein